MYIAMNRFRIANDHTQDFIQIWKDRGSLGHPNFEGFEVILEESRHV